MAALVNRMANKAAAHGSHGCTCARCMPSTSFGFNMRVARTAPRTVVLRASATQDKIAKLLDNNKNWSKAQVKNDPTFFSRLRDQQAPEYLWIGCADSRVPANVVLGLDPGEVFVQRNVGNQANHRDMNCMACIDFSIKALGVTTIIVCGHYKCGAVKAALTLPSKIPGLVNCWISDIRETRNQHLKDLDGLSKELQLEKLVEYNVLRQVFHVCTSPTVQEYWDAGTELNVYGVVYSLEDGILQQLVGPISGNDILGTPEQGVFVNKAMEVREQGDLLGSVISSLLGAKVSEPAPVLKAPMNPVKANDAFISKQLSAAAGWDKGMHKGAV